ncbi:MAG TPA: 3'-5' exonuclease [Actinomycetes bacterium]|nr:3'-5' exonuclease [Actinomycetes bacterium]
MAEALELLPAGPVAMRMAAPASKSVTTRGLLCAALAEGTSHLRGAAPSDDAEAMASALRELGAAVDMSQASWSVGGTGGRLDSPTRPLDARLSGTTMRFLAAAVTLTPGGATVTGAPPLLRRPVGPLVAALRAARIPYQQRRSIGELAASREVADVLAYLRVLLDPDDVVALRRILNVPERGLQLLVEALAEGEATDLAAVRALAERLDGALGKVGSTGLTARLAAFLDGLAALRPRASPLSIGLLDALLDTTGYLAWVRRQPHAPDRLAALDVLRGLIDGAGPDPAAWLADLLADDAPPLASADAVLLTSIHSAKGAEFPAVFVVGLEEGVLPDYRSLADPVALQGELAVLYVGVTRARRLLFLSHCAAHWRGGEHRPAQPSRFLTHLPAGLLVSG